MAKSAKSNNKVIITCAITGAIHTPSMSPHLPITPDQIVEAAIGAAEAGAAIVHLHARNPETGRPDQSPEAFGKFVKRIKQSSNVVINLTSGGSPDMRVEQRVSPAHTFKPEVASLNMGSMNFALYPMLNRYKDFKHEWERTYLEGTRDLVFRNTFKDIEFVLRTCADNGTRFEFECYDIGHLYNLAHFLERGLVKPPLFVQSVFGILGGIGTHPEDVAPHAADRRPAARAGELSLVGARRRPRADGDRRHGGGDGRQSAGGSGGFAVDRAGQTCGVECPAGQTGATNCRRPRLRSRGAGRRARNSRAQGR